MARSIPLQETWLGEIDSWQTVKANCISRNDEGIEVSGNVLIGPHQSGAQALVPPGVYSNVPASYGVAEPLRLHRQWMHSIWDRLDDSTVDDAYLFGYPVSGYEQNLVWLTGKEKPVSLDRMDLQEATGIVRSETPESEDFLRKVVISNLLRLSIKAEPTADPPDNSVAKQAQKSLVRLSREADEAFGQDWLSSCSSVF